MYLNTFIKVNAVGSLFDVIPKISVSWEGSLNITGNLWISAKLKAEKKVIKEKLLEVPITPFEIPGLFAFGPDFVINFNIVPSAQLQAGINVGYTYAYDYFKVSFGTHQKAHSYGFDQPEVYGKVNVTAKGEAIVQVELIPKLAFTFMILGMDFDMASVALYSNIEAGLYAQAGINNNGEDLVNTCTKAVYFTGLTVSFLKMVAAVASTKPITLYRHCMQKTNIPHMQNGDIKPHKVNATFDDIFVMEPLKCIRFFG